MPSFSRTRDTYIFWSQLLGVRVWVSLRRVPNHSSIKNCRKTWYNHLLSSKCIWRGLDVNPECSDPGQCICVDHGGWFIQIYRLHIERDHSTAGLWGVSFIWTWPICTQHLEFWRTVKARLFNHRAHLIKHTMKNIHARHRYAFVRSRHVNSYSRGIVRRGISDDRSCPSI